MTSNLDHCGIRYNILKGTDDFGEYIGSMVILLISDQIPFEPFHMRRNSCGKLKNYKPFVQENFNRNRDDILNSEINWAG